MTLSDPGVTLCAGEALIALVPCDGRPLELTEALAIVAAGAELNVAVHLARLGLPARFAGLVGDDPFGRRVRAALVQEGVDVSTLLVQPSRPTGFYLKAVEPEGSSMRYFRRGSAASSLSELPAGAHDGVGHLHLTGITPALSPECARLVHRELESPKAATTSFDVNYRSALWDPAAAATALHGLARLATVVFVGLDEARRLWGCPDAGSVRNLLPEPDELVVKDGPRDATAFTEDGSVSVAAQRVEVLDLVGAGDAFAAGYLAGRWRGEEPAEALASAHSLAVTVIGSYSDHGARGGDASLAQARENPG